MIPYLIGLVFLFVAGFVVKSKPLGIISILYLLMLSMFRGKYVGSDTINYLNPEYGRILSEVEGMKSVEIITVLVSQLIPYFGIYTVVWFYSITTFLFIILACNRFKVNVTYAFFFFVIFIFYNQSLNISRQFAAACVLLYAYSFLLDEGLKKYLFFPIIILAAGIHSSAIVFIFFFFIRKIPLSKINPIILISVVLTSYIVMQSLAQSFIDWANLYALFIDDEFSNYVSYFGMTEESDRTSFGIMASVIIYALNTYILIRLLKNGHDYSSLIAIIFFVGIFVTMFFDNIYGSLGRMRYYGSIINIVAYSYYMMYDKAKIKMAVFYSFVFFYGLLYIRNMIFIKSYDTVPYYFGF